MQDETFARDDAWRTARHGAAALTDLFFSSGCDVVVVEGGFYTAGERDDVARALASNPRVIAVTLMVSYEDALRRAQSDPSPDRVASKNPATLRWLHAQFTDALPFLEANTRVLDAGDASIDELATQIVTLIGPG